MSENPEKQLLFNALSWRAMVKPGLQLPGRPLVLRDVQYGGGDDRTDRRMVLDTAQLRMLLDMAENSTTGRVVLHRVGIRVMLLRDQSGHQYEWCSLVASKLEAEASGFLVDR
jgi:hypothetical protein